MHNPAPENVVKVQTNDFKTLVNLLYGPSSICNVISETTPSLLPNNLGNVLKICTATGLINWRYQHAVQNRIDKENLVNNVKIEEFKAEERRWGMKIDGTPFIFYKRQLYLELQLHHSTSVYLINGLVVDKSVVQPFFKPEKFGRQLQENKVRLRDYRLNHIREIHAYGRKIKLIQDDV